eukprot:1237652-Prymnesium_polylepis.2
MAITWQSHAAQTTRALPTRARGRPVQGHKGTGGRSKKGMRADDPRPRGRSGVCGGPSAACAALGGRALRRGHVRVAPPARGVCVWGSRPNTRARTRAPICPPSRCILTRRPASCVPARGGSADREASG